MWALIPIKNLNNAKQRLSELLSPDERKQLFRCMLLDVIRVLRNHPLIAGVALVSNDVEGVILAKQYDALLINESAHNSNGLSGAIEEGITELANRGIKDVMVIHGDLPVISEAEVTTLIEFHRKKITPAVTLVPDALNKGSNCIVCSPATSMRFHYGLNSLHKHREQVLNSGMNFQLMRLAGMGLDIDLPTDIEILIEQFATDKNTALATRAYLEQTGIAKRLQRQGKAKFIHQESPTVPSHPNYKFQRAF